MGILSLSKEETGRVARLYNAGATWEECSEGARIFQSVKNGLWNGATRPAKSFSVTREDALPTLAWLCEIHDDTYSFIIGPGVESGLDYIVEGVWDDDFIKGEFGNSEYLYGSGAYLDKDGFCVFSPPRLCTDYLFVLHDRKRGISWVSNSFNFIFARCDIDLNGGFYKKFRIRLNSSTNLESSLGADRGSPLITENESYVMYRAMYHNFTVSADGRINYRMRLPEKLFLASFNDYKNFLHAKAGQILRNGSASERIKPFGAITMLSTGYDSCATSAICAKCGVKEAITLDVVVGGHKDSGENIADILGLACYKALSPLGRDVPVLKAKMASENSDLLEFIATPGIGDNLAFKNMEPHISGKMVFSGLYGDGCWSRKGNGGGLAHHLPYMKSRMEFRLRTGYALVPVPAFGAYFPYILSKLNSSEEMRPWSLNNSYDRPIPRRIAEEANVPRELFGMKKAANNPDIVNWRELFDESCRHMMRRYAV